MMMDNFMYDVPNKNDTLIKLEICEILNYYLDFIMDFYLNNLKLKFREWVSKLRLYDKIE